MCNICVGKSNVAHVVSSSILLHYVLIVSDIFVSHL